MNPLNVNLQKMKWASEIQQDNIDLDEPQGLIWDGENYSWAYDSLFSIIWNIWLEDPIKWTRRFSRMSEMGLVMTQGFADIQEEKVSVERIRNNICHALHSEFPNLFPYGHQGASVVELAEKMFYDEQPNASAQLQCTNCDFVNDAITERLSSVIHGVP